MNVSRLGLHMAAAALLASGTAQAASSTLFRIVDLDLRDPHVWIDFIGCHDVTDTALAGFAVNSRLQSAIGEDGDMDGFLDLSYVLEFAPLDQAVSDNPLRFGYASCAAPSETSSCLPIESGVDTVAALSPDTSCLAPVAGTLRPYTPAVTTVTAPCFASAAATFTIDLAGIPVTLTDTQVAATFDANPASHLVNGLLRGFISEADANATLVPAAYPVIGGKTLSSLLSGGSGTCATGSDQDTNGVAGWWFYFNFRADEVPPERVFADGFD